MVQHGTNNTEMQNQLNYRTAQNTQSEIKENHLQRATGAKTIIVHAFVRKC